MEEKVYTAGCAAAIPEDAMVTAVAGVLAKIRDRADTVSSLAIALGMDRDAVERAESEARTESALFMAGLVAGLLFTFMPEGSGAYGEGLAEYAERTFAVSARKVIEDEIAGSE